MYSLTNRQVILGITGGIAAYKAAELVRNLKAEGAHVKVVMTAAAEQFITPLTLQALSGEQVHTSLLDPEAEAGMGHIELARWADLLLVAPASADFMARLAAGKADDLLTTLCLATPAPLVLAPAMNQQMWADAATQANREVLLERGILLIGPAEGEQACGDVGPGRMVEPVQLLKVVQDHFGSRALEGVRIAITAGPTREAIDPVRYISNYSSGKMGFALARAAAEQGADVTLIAGPVNQVTPDRVKRVDVVSAQDMYDASMNVLQHGCDIYIASAAVADYRLREQAPEKIKKSQEAMILDLVKNPDIVSAVAAHQMRPSIVVGFAAETQDVVNYARAKLKNKNLDMIVANDVSRRDIGFNSDENEVRVITQQTDIALDRMGKNVLAARLIDLVRAHYQQK